MFCENCGHKLTPDSKFCDKCGHEIPSHLSTSGDKNEKANKHNKKVLIIFFSILGILILIGIISNSSDNPNLTQTQLTDNTNNSSSSDAWKEFNSVEGNFKILFPKFPTHETENVSIPDLKEQPKMELYTSEPNDKVAYLATYIKYSDNLNFAEPKTILENSVNFSTQNVENSRVVSTSFSKFSNYDAIDYLIYSPKDSIYVKGKNIWAGNTLYALLISYNNISDIQEDKFYNSFQLIKSPPPQSKQNAQELSDELSPVEIADYQEGYKAGYVDGRSSYGQLGDNYSEPATEERKSAYFVGYLFGFRKGCIEGNFDCSKVEEVINSLGEEQTENVNLIPPNVY
jgi:hypothetical protein